MSSLSPRGGEGAAEPQAPFNRSAVLGAATSLLSFLLTARAASPGLTGGDSGELISVSNALSTAHPPGYPLYVWLGKAASLFLWGPLAHRYNLFSALCAAAAAGLLAAALHRWTKSALISSTAALAFVCTRLMLEYATRAEVFALNQAMAALVLLLAVRCDEAPTRARALALGAAAGLGLGNHLTLLLVAAPLVFVASKGHRAAAALGALAGGVLIYALVPLGAVLGPTQAWGDVLTPAGFLAHVTRADYGTLQLAANAVGESTPLLPQLAAFARSQLEAVGWVGAPLALYGAVRAWRERKPFAAALLVGWLLASFGFLSLARFPMTSPLMVSVLERFFLLPQLALFVFAALGAAALPKRALVAACALAMIGSAARYMQHRPAPDSLPELYAAALLEPLPPNAVLLIRGDLISNSARYAQATGMRPDVAVLDEELLTYPWYVARRAVGVVFPAARWNPGLPGGFSLAELVAANPTRPFFTAGTMKPGDASAAALGSAPAGLADRLQPAPPDVAAEQQLLASAFARAAAQPRADLWEQALTEELWEAQHRVAVAQLMSNDAANAEERLWRLIEGRGEAAPAQYYRNAAIASARLGHLDRMKVAAEKYLALAPADAPDRAAFEAELRRLNGAP